MLYAADSGGGPTLSNNRIDIYDEALYYLGSFSDPGAPSNMTVFVYRTLMASSTSRLKLSLR